MSGAIPRTIDWCSVFVNAGKCRRLQHIRAQTCKELGESSEACTAVRDHVGRLCANAGVLGESDTTTTNCEDEAKANYDSAIKQCQEPADTKGKAEEVIGTQDASSETATITWGFRAHRERGGPNEGAEGEARDPAVPCQPDMQTRRAECSHISAKDTHSPSGV